MTWECRELPGEFQFEVVYDEFNEYVCVKFHTAESLTNKQYLFHACEASRLKLTDIDTAWLISCIPLYFVFTRSLRPIDRRPEAWLFLSGGRSD
jgi:hypothetical protein